MTKQHSSPTITAVLLLSIALFTTHTVAQSSTAKQQTQSAGSEKTLTGVISDSMCGAKHMAKGKSAAECTRMCVQQGQKYALVVGDKVYTLSGHEPELDKLAGQRVNVTGKLSGDTVSVSSVTSARGKSAS